MDLNTWKDLKLPLNLFNLLMRHIKQIQDKEKGSNNTTNTTNTNNQPQVITPINNVVNNNLNSLNNNKNSTNITSNSNSNNKFSNQITTSNSNSLNNNNYNNNLNQVKNNNINNTNSNNNFNTLYEIRYNNKESLKEDIFTLLDQVVAQAKSKEIYEPTLKTLFKILENIKNTPTNEQYRKIKKSSNAYSTKIAILKSAEYFLYCLGFMDDGEYIYLDKFNLENLKNAVFYFESFMIKYSK
jgi:hypothetical protein